MLIRKDNSNLNLTKLKLFCFIICILFLSKLSNSNKITAKTEISTAAITSNLLGNQWQQIADEVTDSHATKIFFEVPNKYYLMAYGTENKWTIKHFKDSFICSNSFFREDPYNGKVKGCYRLNNFSSYKLCATEGGTCNMTEKGNKLVRYGFDDRYNYAYKFVTGNSIGCSNSVFGDPIRGKKKNCWYVVTDV